LTEKKNLDAGQSKVGVTLKDKQKKELIFCMEEDYISAMILFMKGTTRMVLNMEKG